MFGHKQRRHKKRMVTALHHGGQSILVNTTNAQAMLVKRGEIRRIKSESATIVLGNRGTPVDLRDARGGIELYDTRTLEQWSRQGGNNGPMARWIRFGMIRVAEAEYRLGIFDDRVLKSGATAEKGHALLARESNSANRGNRVPVRAAGSAPDRIEVCQVVGAFTE